MKSLSILILLGTLIALLVGGIFAVRPVFAEKPDAQPAEPIVSEPLAPTTGKAAANEAFATGLKAEVEIKVEPAASLAATFTLDIEKDTAGALAAQEDEARFDRFVASVSNGKSSQVTGIYVEDVLAFPVIRQPNSNSAYVSENPSVVTQFSLAAEYGSTAFLAHNYLAGATFFNLSEGQVITLVYGDGSSAEFQIQSIRRFQALSPDSTQSSFIDLDSNEQLSASNLFYRMYNSDNSVVLQTCIVGEGISTWGRLFVIAVPLS